jgi:hypothetical protein
MAIINHRLTITLTASATTISLDVTDPYDLYEIETATTIAIPGTTNIVAVGTVIEGLTYNFRYIADVTAGNVSIMGALIPAHLRDKRMLITAFYDGTTWVVDFEPDLSQAAVIDKANLIEPPGTHVVAKTYTPGISSAATTGLQTLATAIIPSNTLGGSGVREAFRITAWGVANAADVKNLTLQVVTGGTTHILFQNNNQALQGLFKIEAVVTATPPGIFQSEAILLGGDQLSTGFLTNGITWDYSVAQNVEFIVEDTTGAGSLVTLRQLRVEKITV